MDRTQRELELRMFHLGYLRTKKFVGLNRRYYEERHSKADEPTSIEVKAPRRPGLLVGQSDEQRRTFRQCLGYACVRVLRGIAGFAVYLRKELLRVARRIEQRELCGLFVRPFGLARRVSHRPN